MKIEEKAIQTKTTLLCSAFITAMKKQISMRHPICDSDQNYLHIRALKSLAQFVLTISHCESILIALNFISYDVSVCVVMFTTVIRKEEANLMRHKCGYDYDLFLTATICGLLIIQKKTKEQCIINE